MCKIIYTYIVTKSTKYFIVCKVTTCIYVMQTNLMHCLSSVYSVSQPLHVSGIFVAHHQEV